ncbi:hypothetical protein CROQUDRAFT_668382 [Cronartium quercuum f. sp. fusiforme G11]|uniref:Uncharacterized protein n=1 Tax=Cronartium quercuum f. sp. fusiforme G11 TaxID=708437 RepID=A0A9P6TFL3_9BASI|nr:hypothetical protein CROQUDRAFT_668382 [Cronartium quercuum f. sp. fusiforme G11]
MSTELYYTVSNPNQSSPDPSMGYMSDRSALLHGLRNRASAQQQANFGHGGINMYQQQQIQAALYQQQQLEFAQQQAQLEMHLQLEQMRLQNLALQEQIMIGQVHAHQQAQAQAQAEQYRGTFHHQSQKAPGAGRLNFGHSQIGSSFAERALARRQQAEADALYAQYYPNEQEEDELLQEMPLHAQRSERGESQTPPALVFSKPDEAFPILASASAAPAPITAGPTLTSKAHQHTDSGSSVSTFGSLSSFTTRSPEISESELAEAAAGEGGRLKPAKAVSASSPPKKKFSDVVKSSPAPAAKPTAESKHSAPVISVNTAVAPKLNPFSSVFVPGSGSSPASSTAAEKVTPSRADSPAIVSASSLSVGSNKSVSTPTTVESCAPAPAPAAGLYRAVRSKSPPTSLANGARAPASRSASSSLPPVVMGAMPMRQPRGPAAEAELTNQNFATRIRKRAIGAIKTLGARVPGGLSSSPTPTSFHFHPQIQQSMIEGLLHQQAQAQAAGFHPFLEVEQAPGYPHGMVSPGLAHLMVAARAREERFGY